ncbi:MAG: PilZ domain-containing protein [Candidatus Eremiobacteraeota bacterium]|nr:PilZ domain-containing protein [Candidatus Eremiobacteraeota bacterium]
MPPLARRSRETSGLQDMVNYAADRLALLRLQNLRESLADVEEILHSLKRELEVRRQDGRSVRLTEQLIWEAEQERARLLGQISAAVDVPGIYRERRRRSDSEESFERTADPRTRITQHFSKFHRSREEFTREDYQPVRARGPLYRDQDFEDDVPYYYSRPVESERSSPDFELRKPAGSAETPSWLSVRVERKARTHPPATELRLGGDSPPVRRPRRPKPQPFSLSSGETPTRRSPAGQPKPAPLAWLSRAEKPAARAPLFEPQDITAEDLPAIPEDDELLLQDDLLDDLDLSGEEFELGDLDVGDLDLDELGEFDYDNLDLEGDDLLALDELDANLLFDEDEAELVDEELGAPFLDDLDLELEDDLELAPAVADAEADRAYDIDDSEGLEPFLDAQVDYDLGALEELDELEVGAFDLEVSEDELDLGELADVDLDHLDFDELALDDDLDLLEPEAEMTEVVIDEPLQVDAPEAPVELEEPILIEPPAEVEEPIAVEAPIEVEESIAVEPPAEVEEPIAVEVPAEVEEPIAVEAPAEVEEPIAVEAPVEVEEPIAVEAPIEVEEPITVEAPAEVEEPIAVEAPAEVEEPIAVGVPAEVEEPIAVEAPVEVEEPIAFEAPVEVEEPIAVEAPAEVEEPIAVEVSGELAGPANLFEGPDQQVTEPVFEEPVTEFVSAELPGPDDLFEGQPIVSGEEDFFASSEPLAVIDSPAASGEDLLVGSGESMDVGGDFFGDAGPTTASWLDEPLAEPTAAPVAPTEEAPVSQPSSETSLEAAIEEVAAEEAVAAPPPGAVEAAVATAPSFDGGASAQERRRLVRLACSYDTSAYLEGRPVSVKLVDISLGGGKLQGPASNFQRGQLIQVSNPLPEARVKDPVTARIVWLRPSRDEEGKFDIGLQFEESPEVLGKSWVITVLNKIGMQSKVFNQRKYTRAAANLPIEIDLKTKERHPGTALDIGLGGALLAVDRPLSPTTRFTLHMGPLGNHDKLELNCEVISSRHDEAGIGWTHSAKFAEISTTQTKLLGKYVVDLLKTGGSV